MKRQIRLFKSIVIVFMIFLTTIVVHAQSNNSISGIVFDSSNRHPISDIYVELMNEVYSTLQRIRTDGSGRFFFDKLSAGNFKVRVLTTGTNYREETLDASIVSVPRGGSNSADRVYFEVYLRPDTRKIKVGSPGAASAIFVQPDIPDDARKLYKKGVEEIEDKQDAGFENIKKAIEIFPTYYEALDRIGTEYVKRKQYREAVPFLIKAIDINQRSFSSFYGLGLASHYLNHRKEAIEALRAATIINQQSFNAQLWYGIVLRLDGDFVKAEKALLQAKSLSKNSPIAEVHWQLALLYNKNGQNKKAVEELETFLKIQPNDPNAAQIKNLISQLRTRTE